MTRFAGKKVDLSTYMNTGTDFGKLAESGQVARSYLNQAALGTTADDASRNIMNYGNVMSGKLEADEIRESGEASARATESNMWSGLIGDVAGGVLGGIGDKMKFTYGKTKLGAGGGVVDGTGTLGPDYGFPKR